MLRYVSWIAFLVMVGFGLAMLRKSASTSFNSERINKAIARKLRTLAKVFLAFLLAVCMVFVNLNSIKDYLFSVLPEHTINSAYSVIKILFGTPSVTYALNSLCVYFVIGFSIPAVCVFSLNILMTLILWRVSSRESTSENNYKIVLKQSYCNILSFISLRKIRI